MKPNATEQQQQQESPFAILDFVKGQMEKTETSEKKVVTPAVQEKVTPEKKVATPEKKEITPEKKEVTPEKKEVTPEEDDSGLSDFAKSILGEKPKEKAPVVEDEIDKLNIPETSSVAAKDAFKKVNGDRARLKKELDTLKAEKEELSKKISAAADSENAKKVTTLEKELTDLRTKGEEAERRLYALDVKQTQKWNQLITEPLNTLGKAVEDIATKYDLDPKTLRQALAGTDTKVISELIGDLNEFDKVELAKLRTEVHSVLKIRTHLESDAKEAHRILQEATEKEQEQVTTQRRSRFTAGRDKASQHLAEVLPFAFKEIEGDAEWNKLVTDHSAFVKGADPSRFTAEEMGETVALAASVPVLGATINRMAAELRTMQEKYQKLAKTKPAAGPKAGGNKDVVTSTATDIDSYVQEQLGARGR